MAPPVASAELKLEFGTIWAADFDPNNKDFLFVGGGGGESRSGVGNKIALLDASKKHELSQIVDIDLSRNEDSVSTLAVARSSAQDAILYAGVNSSEADQKQGKNEHFRSFSVGLPGKRKRDENTEDQVEKAASKVPTTKALGKASMFRAAPGDRFETYQRVLRLSSPVDDRSARMGVIATGLAPAGEVILFDASIPSPNENSVLKRIRLDNRQEAADADVIQTSENSYLAAYCTNYEISVCPVSLSGKAKATEPRLLYQYPIPDVFRDIKRPAFRSLRFLTPKLLAAIINLPGRTGTEVLLIDVPSSDALEGSILLRKRLPSSMKSTVSFTTTTLPGAAPTQNVQHVLAVAGSDKSVAILTLDHDVDSNTRLSFSQHTVLRNVHPSGILNVALSSFMPPANPQSAPPQHLKLASTSTGAVTVHTFPLSPYPPTPNGKVPTRYTLRRPGGTKELAQTALSVFMAVLLIAVGTFAMQAFLEIRGGTPEYLGAKSWIGERGRNWLARPYIFEDGRPENWFEAQKRGTGDTKETVQSKIEEIYEDVKDTAGASAKEGQNTLEEVYEDTKDAAQDAKEELKARVSAGGTRLSDALKSIKAATDDPDTTTKAIVIKDDVELGLSTEVHQDEDLVKKEHKRWEELHDHERAAWKQKLIDAGHWVEAQGESVLQGVFFGELAGMVGDAIRG